MRRLALVVPGSIAGRTGGYVYDRRMVEGLRLRAWHVDVVELDGSFPRPTAAAAARAGAAFAAVPDGTAVLVDSLALGALPDELEAHAARLRLVALVHLPLCAAVTLNRRDVAAVAARERRALAAVRLAIVTGRHTVALMADHDLRAPRIVVVEPGTARGRTADGSGSATLHMLCVATVNRGKGHADLIAALAALPTRAWHLTCAGSLDRDREAVAHVRTVIREHGLEPHVTLAGELDAEAVEAFYLRSDLFVLATLQETYGMAVAEALSHGLPVVSTKTGAIPELVGDAAGILVAPGDRAALAAALQRVVADDGVCARLRAGALRARETLRSWETAVAELSAALESIDA